MRIASLILGILGGIIGIIGGIFAFTVGGLGQAFGADGAATVANLGMAAIPAGILGIIGGAMAIAKPKLAGFLMLISAVSGLIFVSAAYVVAFILLIVGSILAFIGQKEVRRQSELG